MPTVLSLLLHSTSLWNHFQSGYSIFLVLVEALLVLPRVLPHGRPRDPPVLKGALFSCLCGVDSMGEFLGRLLVAISSARYLSQSVSVLAQPSSAIHIYSRDPITL